MIILGIPIPNIVIDGNLVETVEYATLLGVTLSNDLTWDRNVECIVKKAAKRVYMRYQLNGQCRPVSN